MRRTEEFENPNTARAWALAITLLAAATLLTRLFMGVPEAGQ